MTRPPLRRKAAAAFAAFAVVALALAPALAEARAGGRSSSGSRGSATQSAPPATNTAPGGAQRFDRTETPATRAPAPATAGAATAGGMASTAAARGGFFSRNPMMAGLMGGLLGAGLFGLLSGSGLFGGLAGLAGVLGLMLQLALIGGLVFLVIRLIRGRSQPTPAMAGGPQGAPRAYARDMQQGMGAAPLGGSGSGSGSGSGIVRRPLEVTGADFTAFEQHLQAVQDAWSRQDITTLRRLSTAEMERYFAQDLQDLAARGWTNTVRDVTLESGDLSEAWNENGQDYATVAMRFSMIDTTMDGNGQVVEGHPTNRETATEFWTFTRRPGATWVLSAIQQAS